MLKRPNRRFKRHLKLVKAPAIELLIDIAGCFRSCHKSSFNGCSQVQSASAERIRLARQSVARRCRLGDTKQPG